VHVDLADIELSSPRFTKDPITHLTFQSPALGGRGNVLIHLPPGHEKDEGLPVVMLLHGVLGSHWSWAYNGGAHLVAQDLVEGDRTRPMALVMPSDGMVGQGSGYVNTLATACEDWIVRDVPSAVSQVFPNLASSPMFIAGFSMGGFGALRIGAKHCDVFRGISGLSSIVHFDGMELFVATDSPDFQHLKEEDKSPLHWMKLNRRALPPLRFDCGIEDRLFPDNLAFHDALEAEDIPHLFVQHPGTHSWQYWNEHLAETLQFFNEVLD